MKIEQQIKDYMGAQTATKRSDMEALHHAILQIMPSCKLWFLEGKDNNGKTVSNPSIGYGSRLVKYADGTTKEFYQIGLSANKSGISVYILGINDKTHLAKTYGSELGRATVTGYCIRFKALKDINIGVLESAIRDGVKASDV